MEHIFYISNSQICIQDKFHTTASLIEMKLVLAGLKIQKSIFTIYTWLRKRSKDADNS